MPEENPTRHTVTSNEQFDRQLMNMYPAANSVPAAFAMAAQDGIDFKRVVENDLETYIRKTVRDELDSGDSGG